MHHYPRRITTFHRSRETLPSAQITLRATFVHILVGNWSPCAWDIGRKEEISISRISGLFQNLRELS